jgi:hypothetical protein
MLNPHHTNFVFVNNNTNTESVIDVCTFRSHLETHIRQSSTHVIVILYEGDIECLYQAVESLSQGTPLLICKNSGGAADLLADIIYQYRFVIFYILYFVTKETLAVSWTQKNGSQQIGTMSLKHCWTSSTRNRMQYCKKIL